DELHSLITAFIFSCEPETTPAIHLPASFFFFNDAAPTELYTLSLHDALPISGAGGILAGAAATDAAAAETVRTNNSRDRSEEHTSELQSLAYLVCRLLLE